MTIGVAAISGRPKIEQYSRGTGNELIVMAADRQVTFGVEGGPQVRSESAWIKKIGLLQKTGGCGRCGWHLLYAGETDEARRIAREFRQDTEDWDSRIPESEEIADAVGRAIQTVRTRAFHEQVLKRWEISLDNWPMVVGSLPLPISTDVNDAIKAFDRDWGCDFLICGFDQYDRPTILRANSLGGVYSESGQGYATIGMGEDLARSRLLVRNLKATDSFEDVFFTVFDGLQQAQIEISVSSGLADVWVLHRFRELPAQTFGTDPASDASMAYKMTALAAAETVAIPNGEWRQYARAFADGLRNSANASPNRPRRFLRDRAPAPSAE